MHDLQLTSLINGPNSANSSIHQQDESDSSHLNTPQLFGISPTLLYMNNSGDMPSTAEIIQKCLTVNPFDLKFREANMQISGQTPEHSTESRVNSQGLPITPSGITLKLPSSLNQSPNIFSNVLSAAEIEGRLRENLDFSRKVQQLREAHLVKQEGNRTPCTADVLNAVLDMNMNNAGLRIPSTSSLVAGLTADVSTGLVSTTAAPATITSSSSTLAPTALPATGLLAAASADQSGLGFAFQAPANPEANPISQANLAATTAAALLQQQTTIANMISSQSSLNPATLNTNQSMPNLHAGFQSTNNNSAPASNALAALRASPGLTNHSPRSTSHLLELHKNSAVDVHRAASVDPWDTGSDVKPLLGKALAPYSMYESAHGRLELKTDGFSGLNAASSADSSSSSQPNSHLGTTESSKPHRKYARYHNPNGDMQLPSGRGGRGRRSLTSEMPPDERRMTILERNKAAAVRYRKRKKEEHDDMISRVHGLEQDKVFLQTQNQIYKKEIDRLTELLKARDARCLCRAADGLPFNAGSNPADGINADKMLNGHQAGPSVHLNGSLKHPMMMPDNSQASLMPQ